MMDESTSGTGKNFRELRRIVMLTPDISTIGGIQSRTKKVLKAAVGRRVEYIGLTLKNERSGSFPPYIIYQPDAEQLLSIVKGWSPTDTVVLVPNNTLRLVKEPVLSAIERLPLIFNGSGQLTFMLQDSTVLADLEYVDRLRATKLLLFSQMDRSVYSQLGIYDHELGFHPVDVRDENPYDPARNRYATYVGRIDFFAKGAERLLAAATALAKMGKGPLRVFTASKEKNSPQLSDFLHMLHSNNLSEHVEIIYDEENPEVLYREASILLLPSKKDAFPNVILEAASFGVPAVAMAYAPGPSEIILNGETGHLIDNFDAATLESTFSRLDAARLRELSARSFERHRMFSMARYFEHIEQLGKEAVNEFSGRNEKPVFPRLAMIEAQRSKLEVSRRKHQKLIARTTLELETAKAEINDLRMRLRFFSEEPQDAKSKVAKPLTSEPNSVERTFPGRVANALANSRVQRLARECDQLLRKFR